MEGEDRQRIEQLRRLAEQATVNGGIIDIRRDTDMVRKSQEKSREVKNNDKDALQLVKYSLTQESDIFAVSDSEGEDVPALTSVQWQAIQLLVCGKRQIDIAQELDVAQETISRWKASPVFAAALNYAVQESYRTTLGALRDARSEAVSVMRELMNSEYVDDKTRLSAAKEILRIGVQIDAGAAALPTTPAGVADQRLQVIADKEFADAFSFDFG